MILLKQGSNITMHSSKQSNDGPAAHRDSFVLYDGTKYSLTPLHFKKQFQWHSTNIFFSFFELEVIRWARWIQHLFQLGATQVQFHAPNASPLCSPCWSLWWLQLCCDLWKRPSLDSSDGCSYAVVGADEKFSAWTASACDYGAAGGHQTQQGNSIGSSLHDYVLGGYDQWE
jgi:hypothetical protein